MFMSRWAGRVHHGKCCISQHKKQYLVLLQCTELCVNIGTGRFSGGHQGVSMRNFSKIMTKVKKFKNLDLARLATITK